MKKFIFHVGVGDIPPAQARVYVNKLREEIRLQQFFPDDRVIYIPERGDRSYVETVEVDW